MIDFENEVNKYGMSLSDRGQDIARGVFNELLAQGRSFEWLYFAIKRLNGRNIANYPKLLFYKEFQEEVECLQCKGREVLNEVYHIAPYRHWRANILSLQNSNEEAFEKRYKEEQKEFELAYYAKFLGVGYVKISDEEKEFCDDYYNESYEYKLENEEKVIALYDKYFVLPYFEEALNND